VLGVVGRYVDSVDPKHSVSTSRGVPSKLPQRTQIPILNSRTLKIELVNPRRCDPPLRGTVTIAASRMPQSRFPLCASGLPNRKTGAHHLPDAWNMTSKTSWQFRSARQTSSYDIVFLSSLSWLFMPATLNVTSHDSRYKTLSYDTRSVSVRHGCQAFCKPEGIIQTMA
jgi:hypothetical protein